MSDPESPNPQPPSGVRPVVPPPPPGFETPIRVTGSLSLRDTRPLAWTEVATRLGQVEPMAIDGVHGAKAPPHAKRQANPLAALKEKLMNLGKKE